MHMGTVITFRTVAGLADPRWSSSRREIQSSRRHPLRAQMKGTFRFIVVAKRCSQNVKSDVDPDSGDPSKRWPIAGHSTEVEPCGQGIAGLTSPW